MNIEQQVNKHWKESFRGNVMWQFDLKKIKINTKFGNFPFEGKNFNLDYLKKSFDQSLKRLKKNKIC